MKITFIWKMLLRISVVFIMSIGVQQTMAAAGNGQPISLAKLRSNRVKTFNLSSPEKHKLNPHSTLTLLNYKGAGQIVRLHMSIGLKMLPRNVLLKIYWDGEEHPSVLCPIGDFFCNPAFDNALQFATPYFGNHGNHWYCYLPMPFEKGARIEVENQSGDTDGIVAYDVSVEEWAECPSDLARFHACWRRENPTQPKKPYTVLDIKGKGHFVGCNLTVQAREKTLSFLEGLTRIYVDEQAEPVLKVWGTEDFFGGSYYFRKGPYAGPYSGSTVVDKRKGRFAGYRLLVPDAIPFEKKIKVLISHGAYPDGGRIFSYSGKADYSSVAYWYQVEPHDFTFYQGLKLEDRQLTKPVK